MHLAMRRSCCVASFAVNAKGLNISIAFRTLLEIVWRVLIKTGSVFNVAVTRSGLLRNVRLARQWDGLDGPGVFM